MKKIKIIIDWIILVIVITLALAGVLVLQFLKLIYFIYSIIRKAIMKKIAGFIFAAVLVFAASCNGQPKTDYEIAASPVPGAVKYHFFLEKKSASPYQLIQEMDYLNPNVTALKVGEGATPVFTVNLVNDGAEYKVGIVAETTGEYYSGMGTGIGVVGSVPAVPGSVILRKKN